MSLTTLVDRGSGSRIAKRTRGQKHGPITRLMSPSDFGRLLKPFVFLDLIDNQGTPFTGFGLHPHSGIATVTYIAEGSVRYEDTNGATGLLPAGGIEWMRAGGGVWHGGGLGEPGRTRGFQLWIALPPDLELGPSESIYRSPEAVPIDGPVRVLIGSYGTATSSIKAPSPMNYFAVRLKAGERWSYQPPTGHTVLWTAVGKGSILVPDEVQQGELVAFTSSSSVRDFEGAV
jgi:redox-sensitive bicupin YhaK (pirin superfamily)